PCKIAEKDKKFGQLFVYRSLLYRLPRDESKTSLRSGRACKSWHVERYWFFSILVDFNLS
ncbi:MAG: hypothetical protein J5973_07585, partial [Eubacterium sp.]|nr:hypothetical protein [Eubacterium sp.]